MYEIGGGDVLVDFKGDMLTVYWCKYDHIKIAKCLYNMQRFDEKWCWCFFFLVFF